MNKSFFAALILGIEGMLFFIFVMPQYRELTGARASLEERRGLLEDTRVASVAVERLRKEYGSNESTIANVLRALPQERQYDYITESIRAASVNSGVELSSIVLGEPQKGKGIYKSIPLKLELLGSYADLMVFLGGLERSLRLYDIQKLDLAGGGSESAGGRLVISIQAMVYSLK